MRYTDYQHGSGVGGDRLGRVPNSGVPETGEKASKGVEREACEHVSQITWLHSTQGRTQSPQVVHSTQYACYFPPLAPSLILLQLPWPLNVPKILLPQGLCTGHSLCLERSS